MTHTATKPSPEIQRIETAIASLASAFPEVLEETPWGHRAFKVRAKTFLFLSSSGTEVSLSVKLPQTEDDALALVFTEPTHYGLGKSGWVTAHLTDTEGMTLDLVASWLRESYLAIAPKKLSALLAVESNESGPPSQPQATKPKTTAKKATAKKATAKKPAGRSSASAKKPGGAVAKKRSTPAK